MRNILRLPPLLISLLATGVLLLAIRMVGVPVPEVVENRRLAELPSAVGLLRNFGTWRSGVDAWLADRFPARQHLIGALNYLRYKLGYSGTSRVIVGRDGWLFYDDGSHLSQVRPGNLSNADVDAWVRELKARSELLRASGIPYLVLAAPVKESLYRERVPAYLTASGTTTVEMLAAGVAAAGLDNYVDLHAPLRRAKTAGVPVYSPHDTHWSGEGAYAAYVELMRALAARDVEARVLPRSAFHAPAPGSMPVPQDLAFMLGVSSFIRPDYPQLIADAAPSRITWLGTGRDWTADRVIDTGASGPVLMLTGDSFTNAWLPLLERSFSRIVFSHHQSGFFRQDLIARFRPDAVVLEVIESGMRHAMPPLAVPADASPQARS